MGFEETTPSSSRLSPAPEGRDLIGKLRQELEDSSFCILVVERFDADKK